MKFKEVLNLIDKLERKSKGKKRKCFIKGCEEHAINSHTVQKNGILDKIAYNGHVYELNVNLWVNDLIQFKMVGVDKATTFKGFCAKHDAILFKDFESKKINPEDYKTQLLLSYRCLLHERRLKEIRSDYYQSVLSSNIITSRVSDLSRYANGIESNLYNFESLDFYRFEIEKNLKDLSLPIFNYSIFNYDLFEIAASAIFSFDNDKEMFMKYSNFRNQVFEPLSEIFIHFLPIDNKLVIIVGFHEKDRNKGDAFLNRFSKSNYKQLSDLLLLNVENWVCSSSFYATYLKPIEKKFKEEFKKNSISTGVSRKTPVNIFKVN